VKITVVGTGYVGLVTGACLADMGNHVLCLDVDAAKVRSLNDGHIPIYEPGMEPIVRRNRDAGSLSFTTDVAASVAHGSCNDRGGHHRAKLGRRAIRLAAARAIGRLMGGGRWSPPGRRCRSAPPTKCLERSRGAHEAQIENDFTSSQPGVPQGRRGIEDAIRRTASSSAPTTRARDVLRQLYAPFQRNHER
jgi:UDPglucose 6-dehydrogenase